MLEKLKELVIAHISKTQGKTPDEVSSLLFKKEADGQEVLTDNALNALSDLDKTRIQTLTTKFETEKKELYDKGFSKAKAESLSNYEKGLREKHQITEDLKGTELWDAIATKLTKESNTGEPTEDQVKRSKPYLDTLAQLKKEKEDAVKEWQSKYEGREKELKEQETFKSVSDEALTLLDKLNPILPDEPELQKEWKQIFLNRVGEFKYEKKDGKTIVLKKEDDGSYKALLDEHGHPVAFDHLVKQKASSLFRFNQGERREGSGNRNDGGNNGGNKGYQGPLPKNEKEYNDLITQNAGNEEAQIAITKAFTNQK